ncbi:unnamed protein product [Effrenium voratum]|uniref:Uncharacterized protein n=1 Tax=Effrenium voratum TaxID=2562239 RepID=A0AA36I3W4_9DINO|nr:unnamed protein product [Effrenium voratum]CAJ1442166.1 unnamed protein product [Effrenium voratum]
MALPGRTPPQYGKELCFLRSRYKGYSKWYCTRRHPCYPCLLAGRACHMRRFHVDNSQAMPCMECQKQGLPARLCAVPPPREYRSGGLDAGDWARVETDSESCHICGEREQQKGDLYCASCEAWVCCNPRCRRLARVENERLWFCCHCLGVPLECKCLQTHREVAKMLVEVELQDLPDALCCAVRLPKTCRQLRRWQRRRAWWMPRGLPRIFPEGTWLDDAAALRKMTVAEYEALKNQLQHLRRELQQLERPEAQRMLCMRWLLKLQDFAEPSLLFTFLVRLHNEAEKDRFHLRNRYRWLYVTPLDATIAFWPYSKKMAPTTPNPWRMKEKKAKKRELLAKRKKQKVTADVPRKPRASEGELAEIRRRREMEESLEQVLLNSLEELEKEDQEDQEEEEKHHKQRKLKKQSDEDSE